MVQQVSCAWCVHFYSLHGYVIPLVFFVSLYDFVKSIFLEKMVDFREFLEILRPEDPPFEENLFDLQME